MARLTYFTVKAGNEQISGPLEIWLTAMIAVMPTEARAQAFQYVKKMQGDTFELLNPDGSKTITFRAEPGLLNMKGDL